MTAEEMWALFQKGQKSEQTYLPWAFAGNPDGLAALVLAGKKTATSTPWPLFEEGLEAVPKVGDYSIILNSRGEAVCILRTTRLTLCPFSEVGAGHAAREGEGDLSLSYWRKVHREVFCEMLAEAGLPFQPAMPVLCEEFEKVYPK